MDARELRIGNWVSDKPGRAIQLNLNYFTESWFWNAVNAGEVGPIPLTKEWVLQLGFKDQYGTATLGLTASYGAHLEWDEAEKVVILLDCDNGVIGKPCQYVHEVQNLYFALERKELEFKTLG